MMIQDKFISLEGKVAIITGAGQGIGLAIAQLYAKYGAAVAMVDVSDKCAEEAGKIRELGAEAQAFKCDVTSEDDVKKTVEAVMKAFGHIDILVNNAGIIVRKTVLDTTVEEWDRCMDIGLKGTFLFSKHVVPIMIKEGGGVIVNTASGAAIKGVPDAAPYNAVKGGVAALTRGMAVDFGKYNIRVNCVCPGDILTPMLISEGLQTGKITTGDPKTPGAGRVRRVHCLLRRLSSAPAHRHGGADRLYLPLPCKRHELLRHGWQLRRRRRSLQLKPTKTTTSSL